MDSSPDPKLQELLAKLQQKYAVMGQDLSSYLDGLLHSDYLTYWDYIHLETLLSLQNPKTQFPDEKIFITYHQITELYFSLVLWEVEQIVQKNDLDKKFFVSRLDRIIRYFKNLADSFDIMTDGMERDQFLKFRMSLLPASGFQSAQYRFIEICSTDMMHLVDIQHRDTMDASDIAQQVEKLYWRSGATELSSGKKTLTLQQFEEKYMKRFLELGLKYKDNNLWKLFSRNFAGDPDAIARLREFDLLANVYWPMAHMKSAGRYLHKDPDDIKATGGTNWQKYLPPRFQKIIFFPDLWSDQEKSEWGKAGIDRALQQLR